MDILMLSLKAVLHFSHLRSYVISYPYCTERGSHGIIGPPISSVVISFVSNLFEVRTYVAFWCNNLSPTLAIKQ